MNAMEELSNAPTHDGHTRSTYVGGIQVTDSSAGQAPDNTSQISAEIDQSITRSKTQILDGVSDAASGLTTMTDRIPDPYILSQISSQHLGKSHPTPSSSDSTPQRHLLAAGTKPMTNFNTFTMFPHLPLEIQRAIWKKTLPGPKIFLIQPFIREKLFRRHVKPEWVYNSYYTNYSMPSSILVNREALEVFSKESVLLRGNFICQDTPSRCFQSKIVLDFKIDSIYIDISNQARGPGYYRMHFPRYIIDQVWSGGCAATMLHLILPVPTMYKLDLTDTSFLKYTRGILWFNQSIRHLTFVFADETRDLPCAERDIALEDPIDVDYALNLFEGDPREVPCEEIPRHKSTGRQTLKFDMDALKKLGSPRWAHGIPPFVFPEDLVIDFKIVVKREKAEELARRKKRFYALKELIAQDEDVPWQGVFYQGLVGGR
ncbi:hypothetical protein EAF04_006789 [Stromatinia cepivora]|nr:hypothetical protein EAF04_006789 [Stromatinia cepivora]